MIFFADKDHFFDKATKSIDKEGIMRMLTQYKIGIGETATRVIRTKDNASDKFLEIVTPVDLPGLLAKVPQCSAIVTTGEKAASVIASLTSTEIPKMGEKADCSIEMADGTTRLFSHWRMPSTSRAYPMSLEKKTEYYSGLFHHLGII